MFRVNQRHFRSFFILSLNFSLSQMPTQTCLFCSPRSPLSLSLSSFSLTLLFLRIELQVRMIDQHTLFTHANISRTLNDCINEWNKKEDEARRGETSL